jgi:menaquinol-cytochrome c reductase iron-sulfur subunit
MSTEADHANAEHGDEELKLPIPLPFRLTRRQFLIGLSFGLGGLAATLASAPIIGFIFTPFIRKKEEVWRAVGPVDSFTTGETTLVSFVNASPLPWAGITSRTGSWLRRVEGEDFIAFSLNCTHLGCPVRWLPGPELFMCPCHGGVYYKDGIVAAGPPPKPLPKYPVRVRNGQVEIRTSPIPWTGVGPVEPQSEYLKQR